MACRQQPRTPKPPTQAIMSPVCWHGLEGWAVGGQTVGPEEQQAALGLAVYSAPNQATLGRACAQTQVPACLFADPCLAYLASSGPSSSGLHNRGRRLLFQLFPASQLVLVAVGLRPIPRRKRHRKGFIIYANQTAKSQPSRPQSSHLADAVPPGEAAWQSVPLTHTASSTTPTTTHRLRQQRISRWLRQRSGSGSGNKAAHFCQRLLSQLHNSYVSIGIVIAIAITMASLLFMTFKKQPELAATYPFKCLWLASGGKHLERCV